MTPQEWLSLHRRAGQGDECARAAILAHYRKVKRAQMLQRAREAAADAADTDSKWLKGLYAQQDAVP